MYGIITIGCPISKTTEMTANDKNSQRTFISDIKKNIEPELHIVFPITAINKIILTFISVGEMIEKMWRKLW